MMSKYSAADAAIIGVLRPYLEFWGKFAIAMAVISTAIYIYDYIGNPYYGW